MRWIRIAFSLGLAGLAAGCFNVTVERYLSGALEARVLDASSRAPIASAQVSLRSTENLAAVVEGTTDADGRISLPPLRGKVRVPFYGDTISKPVTLRVEAEGYTLFTTVIPNKGTRADVEHYYRNPNDTRPPAEILLTKEPG